ncbi:heme NO-binding domain-containing protein [Sedimenticola sp.]|uniref:heme NO-binding domain-containing protein n=1 Tax=Sedimenticola sp. TaxID=1940285 RepID=UPI003D1485B4
MYGLVNQAIRDMVVERFGVETWGDICALTGADELFLTMGQYPDELTFSLIESLCKLQGCESDVVLQNFGEYWIDYVAKNYQELFAMAGGDFVTFVKNLNSLHTRVAQMMPELQAPGFSISDAQEGRFVLHYYSQRDGMQPMIIGLFRGLGRRFATAVSLTYLEGKTEGLDHDCFQVEYSRHEDD